jgi:hypothetical protein
LKQDGRNYDNTAFLHLLQIVNRKNLITHEASEDTADVTSEAMERMRKIVDSSKKERESASDKDSDKNNDKDNERDRELKERITAILDTFTVEIKEEDEEATEDIRNLRNFLGKHIKSMQTSILEFLTQYGNMTKQTAKQMEVTLNHLSKWERSKQNDSISDNATYNSMQFMKTYMKNMTVVFPQLILQTVDNETVDCPKHWDISLYHWNDISSKIHDYYDKMRVFYKDKHLTPILYSITSECEFLLDLAMNTPYYTDIKYKGSVVTSVFDERTSRLLFEYYMISIFQKYIDLTENPNMISLTDLESGDSTSEFLMPSLNPTLLQGNKKGLKDRVAKLLLTFISIMERHKLLANLSYDTVMDYVFRSKEREKDTFTDRLKRLTDEERNVDTVMKINKLGAWSKGLQKGLTMYVGDTYDEEREEMEKIAQIENTMRKRAQFEDADNYLEEEALAQYADADEYDMSRMGEDYMDGDTRYGDEHDPDE